MTSAGSGAGNAWPELTLADWADTRDTLHLWTQVVGKVRLALDRWSTTGGRSPCTCRPAA